MRILIALLFFITLSLIKGDYSKADQLRNLTANSKDGIISLNSTGYFYYTMEFPRPYDVVIYFTGPNCRLCDELLEEYKLVAKFYREAGALSAYKDENSNKRAVFFAVMHFTEINKQIFNQLGFNSVPNLFVSQPKAVLIPQDLRALYLRDFKWMITQTDGHVTSHKLLEYINKRTGRQIEYKPELTEVLTMISLLIGVIASTLFLFRFMKFIFLNPLIWFLGSCVIYVICIAGLVYNIIHNVPFTSIDQKGNIEWKTDANRQQLGAEGFVISFCITFVGISIILYHKLIQVVKVHESFMKLSYLILFGTTYIIIKFIEDIYRQKGWYNPRFYPPNEYVKGALMRDQGNSI